ncbi:hypothetical protein SAMN05421856_10670 [Chryseobacterium taichungense]|uniref:histidine kinase n=1 Tax=Chryseobacterium taichungense TaxID=295069 RepID=A0A1H8AW56_9FLAO|nr:ATP-binding protein [Chryseobacterium taichungense]SEM74049.1 hypothetical protein SAMN05421856_10670 [Chryseobacterium taichungense]
MKNISLFLLISITLLSCHKEKISVKKNHVENNYYSKARDYRTKGISDSAFYYYNLAKDEYLKVNDSIGAAESLINMAIIQTNDGDFYGSIESSVEANKLLKRETDTIVKRDLASSYNNMAIASSFLYNYGNAFDFYQKALKYNTDKEREYIYYNNIADALISQGNSKLAQKYLGYAILAKDNKNKSMALNNLGRAKLLEDKNYNPLPEFYQALEIREKNNDRDGLNSSFATLANFYLDKDRSKSLMYAKKMLEKSTEINNPEDQIQALQKIINLDKDNYLYYFKKFQNINDSITISRSKARNQFAYFRYGIEKEKAENLNLTNKNIQKDNHIQRQYFLLVILILAIIFIVILYRKRQIRLKQEKELEVKNTQLKLSKKVHDVVANGIYQVMTKIENQEDFDRNRALDELEFVYEKSRDISYEKADPSNEEKDISEKISELISSFKNEKVNTYTAGNEKELWKNVSKNAQDEVYQIIRELLVNMRKHSGANAVSFRFEKINDTISIYYSDNGIGIPGDIMYKNGLSSTVSRIESIHGEIIFDTKTEKGLKINISFPVS